MTRDNPSTFTMHHHTHAGGNEECGRILDWLAPAVMEDRHQDIFLSYQKGTYSWFFESEEFINWLERDDPNHFLWCYGDRKY